MTTAVSVPDHLFRAAEQHARRAQKSRSQLYADALAEYLARHAPGEVWWAELPAPTGSGPGFRRPVVVVQGDSLNRSRLATAVCVPLTSDLRWADAPGSVLLPARTSGLPRDSVANASQVVALDRAALTGRAGK